jgi:hypothetical protein
MGRIKDYFTEQARCCFSCMRCTRSCAAGFADASRCRRCCAQGLGVSDLPLALVYHELVSIAFAAAMWTVRVLVRRNFSRETLTRSRTSVFVARRRATSCSRRARWRCRWGACCPPARAGARARRSPQHSASLSNRREAKRVSVACRCTHAHTSPLTRRSAPQVRRRAWLTKLPVVRSAEPSRLVVSLAESLLARGALKPATFVGKLWLSYTVCALRQHVWQARGSSTERNVSVCRTPASQMVLLTKHRGGLKPAALPAAGGTTQQKPAAKSGNAKR